MSPRCETRSRTVPAIDDAASRDLSPSFRILTRAGPLTAALCENPCVGWFERVDARNRRRMERLQAKHDAGAEHPDPEDGAAVAVGSYLSFVPSLIGLVCVLLMLVGGARQHRRKHHA